MAVVVPILSTFDNRGVRNAMREIGRAEGAFGKMSKATQLAGYAMAGAGVAAGAFAIKVGVDAVKAAVEEEAAVAKLNTTLTNLGFGKASAEVEKWIDDTQFATGVADDELRPAMDRLLRAGLGVADVQNAVNLALNAAAGSGKSVAVVANALGRAYEGSTTALGKLGLGLDAATLKSGNMQAITGQMSRLFSGQAAAAANTYAGQMSRVKIGVTELQESLGTGILEGFSEAMGGTAGAAGDLASTLRDLQPAVEGIGKIVGGQLGDLFKFLGLITKISDKLDDLSASSGPASVGLSILGETAKTIAGGPFYGLLNVLGKVTDALGVTGQAAADTAGEIAAVTGSASSSGYTGGTPTAGYTEQYRQHATDAYLAWLKAKNTAKDYTKSISGTGGVTAAMKLLQDRFDKARTSVEEWRGKLEAAGDAVKSAKDELDSYAASMRDWVTSGISLNEAFKVAGDSYTAIEDAYLQKIRDGGGEVTAEVRAQAAAAAKAGAISWLDALDQQITDSTELTDKIRKLMGSLNPADTLGNKLLIEKLMQANPADAALAADELVSKNLGPAYAAALSKNFGEASSLGIDVANIWHGQGVREAEAQYQGIKTTLESKLGLLNSIGKQMGQSVADGYNSVVKSMPADVRLPTGGRGKSGQTVNVSVAAGVGNPVEIARTIENVLKSRNVRLGAG